MLKPQAEQTDGITSQAASLQLLLFVDNRLNSRENIQQVQDYLSKADSPYDLQIIEIGEQPHLVEHFKLVATPALVKIAPEPKQTLAGSNLIAQLKKWWTYWQASIDAAANEHGSEKELNSHSLRHSAEVMQLTDQLFGLKQEKEALLEQLQFKDQVLAMLAHDLRSPLTAASIAVETLELAHQLEPARAEELKEQLYGQARQQFRIMDRMITELLQASLSMSAKLKIEPQQLYLQSLCWEIVPQVKKCFQSKSQAFKQDIPQNLPSVYGDRELIRQVIVNLVENAAKYTPQEGTISLTIVHRTAQKIQVSVCDTGPGIPKEKQEHIFERHFRLKRDASQEGYGLGLSLCRNIIRAHYGQIWVNSSPQGSCFHFTLPVYR